MGRLHWIVLSMVFLAVSLPLRADYALPTIKERLVFLISGDKLQLESSGPDSWLKILPVGRGFAVSRFLLQERIASQGLDTGDFSGSEERLREVSAVLKSRPASTNLLVEMVLVAGAADFEISYLAVFDPKMQFPRYFPVREKSDAIELPTEIVASTPAAWQRLLEGEMAKAKRRLWQ